MLKVQKPFKQEAPYLKLLYNYLREHLPAAYKNQIDDYMLHIFTFRSGGILPMEGANYPYARAFTGEKVVLCCAGTFGQHLYSKLKKQGCEIVAWVDDDYWACRRCCLDVDPLEVIPILDFNFVIVAAFGADTCKHLTERIKALGVKQEKILTITQNKEQQKHALQQYLLLADQGE